MSWRNVGKRYQALFAAVAQARGAPERRVRVTARPELAVTPRVDGPAGRSWTQGA